VNNTAEKVIELEEENFYLQAENEYLRKDIETLRWEIEDNLIDVKKCFPVNQDE
jgi:hypothetical protein